MPVHTNNESNNDNSSTDSVIELPLATLHQDRNSWHICAPSTTSSTPSLVTQGLRIGKVSIGPRDHIVITGPNGCGKSTLIEALIHHAQCQHVLYIPQNTSELHIQQAFAQLDALPQAARSQVLSTYAQLNADPDKLLALKHPSPGELRKLLLCLGIQSRPELIVMDEPTNHLDWSSIEVLGQALAQYAGALIVVTHHEYFANLLQTDIA